MAGRRTSLQPNLVLSAMADYLAQGHFQAAPVNLPGPNCGGRFNNKEKLYQKLIEQIRNRSGRGIEKCIAHGASVKTSDYYSYPPIMIAIDCGYKDITKLLLEHKQLDINEKARNGHTPLSYAKMCGEEDIVQLLYVLGAND
ncbi:ankyrin repeat and EF-hand domain-containing protein 1-like [Bolinopsis microptera]|uniref:ankyrin repeat and EF-hand domain-containing protein 1-like n=1 Tax=Bolinopsis microptera TaxID=2820187 RepID=UPI003079EC6D